MLICRWSNELTPQREVETPEPHLMSVELDHGSLAISVWDEEGEPTLGTIGLLAKALELLEGPPPEDDWTFERFQLELTVAAAARALEAAPPIAWEEESKG